MQPKNLRTILSFAILSVIIVHTNLFAQTVDELSGKVDGIDERVKALESTIDNLTKLKISGYVQPEWRWQDVDSLGDQVNSRNAFTIRRGRVKFAHSVGPISAVVYPDITENGVVMKEVYATWNALYHGLLPELSFSMGSMNRPFGYEIAYSSSSRELTERSLAENRLFNGERDLGFQIGYNPTIGDIRPLIEIGLFNGSDNFGAGPVGALSGASNKMGFVSSSSIPFPIGQSTYTIAAGATDSAFKAQVNAAVTKESVLTLASSGKAIGQPAKELIGHFRVPFLLSDELSFDIGASISMGGITEPSNVIGKYSGTNGALVLENTGTKAGSTFQNQNNQFMASNRSIIGVDAQFYLSVLPIGGTIIKGELYTGQMPFYGSAFLFTRADSATLGQAPVASTIYKKMMGFYAMLVQNLSDNLQLAFRYESFDPNTEVSGENFVTKDGAGTITKLRGVVANTGFGGDLMQNTISIDLNIFISGSMRLMFDFDMPTTEKFTRVDPAVATNIQEVADANDNRFTFRMQYKF
jgi:hypothetical protein